MEQALNKIAGFLIFFGAAVIAAMTLAYFAHAAKATGRKPESIQKVAMRLGISFRPNATKG
jgi:hypothetical protein